MKGKLILLAVLSLAACGKYDDSALISRLDQAESRTAALEKERLQALNADVETVRSLVRAIRGPRIADRIMGINMIGSMVSVTLAILSVWLRQSWLLDVCILYALISFLAVVVLAKVCIAAKKQEVERDG